MKKIILFLTIFVIILFNIYPVLHAEFNTPKDKVFLGQASWFDPWDINLYVSVIHFGQTNGILLSNNYTTVLNKPILMYPIYTLIGSVFKDVNPFFLFHFTAILVGAVSAFCIFYFLKFFLKNFSERIFALLAICLGGGLGFLFYPDIQSADLAMTSFTFLSAFQRGHEGIGLLTYISSLIIFFNLTKGQTFKKSKLLPGGIVLLLISLLFYPYYFLSFLLICGIYLFIKNKGSFNISYLILLPFLIPSLVLAFFLYGQISGNETFQGVINQNLPTPNLLLIIFGYGLHIPFSIYQLFFVKKNQEIIFLFVWIIISILLSYLPFGFARFFLRGLYFPFVILSVIAIGNIAKKINVNKIILLTIFTVILLLSTFRVTYSRITASDANTPWYYLSNNEYKALEFLSKNSSNKAGVASLYKFGNIIPAYTNNTVYFGHLLQTPNADKKLSNLYAFYSYQMTPDQAKAFLQNSNVFYVLWGKDEKKVGSGYKKNIKLNAYYTFLKLVFDNNDISIFATM